VVLCTGLGPTAERALRREDEDIAGIREVALKPLDRKDLAGIIRRVLNRGEEVR
jgi:hypothetical protein